MPLENIEGRSEAVSCTVLSEAVIHGLGLRVARIETRLVALVATQAHPNVDDRSLTNLNTEARIRLSRALFCQTGVAGVGVTLARPQRALI
jgi:hypothetical protein